MPTSIFPGAIVKLGWPTAGIVQGESPIPMLRVLSIAFCAEAITASRSPPRAARAPPAFHMSTSPATPRRFPFSDGGAEGTSSLATTVFTVIPASSASSMASFTFIVSPA